MNLAMNITQLGFSTVRYEKLTVCQIVIIYSLPNSHNLQQTNGNWLFMLCITEIHLRQVMLSEADLDLFVVFSFLFITGKADSTVTTFCLIVVNLSTEFDSGYCISCFQCCRYL